MIKSRLILINNLFIKYFPFKIPGIVVLSGSVYLLGSGIASGSTIAVSVSMFTLIFLFSLAGISFIISRKYCTSSLDWRASGFIDSVNHKSNTQTVIVSDRRCPLFFRFRLIIKGKIKTVCSLLIYYRRNYLSDKNGIIKFSFDFSSPGTADGITMLFIEDIFGFTRLNLCREVMRNFYVSAGYRRDITADTDLIKPDAVKKEKKRNNDAEKYLMREYVPGDRYRDINWKASGKIDKLVTKISPGGKENAVKLSFLYLSGIDESDCRSTLKRFIIGKYFREFFISFLYRVRFLFPEFKFDITVDSWKCSIKNTGSFNAAAELLALSASETQKIKTDQYALPEIDMDSSIYIFAESVNLINHYLRLLPEENVVFACAPFYLDNFNFSHPDYISFSYPDFIYSGIAGNLRFYTDMAGLFLAKLRNKDFNSSFIPSQNRNSKIKFAVIASGGR